MQDILLRCLQFCADGNKIGNRGIGGGGCGDVGGRGLGEGWWGGGGEG